MKTISPAIDNVNSRLIRRRIEPWNSLADDLRDSRGVAGKLHRGDRIATIHWSPDFNGGGQFWTDEIVEVDSDADVIRDGESEQVVVIEKSLSGDHDDAKMFSMHCCDCHDPAFTMDEMTALAKKEGRVAQPGMIQQVIAALWNHRVRMLVPN